MVETWADMMAKVWDDQGRKLCPKCQTYKHPADYRTKAGGKGIRSRCRVCEKPQRDKEKRRAKARKYGVVLDESSQHCELCSHDLPFISFRRRQKSANYMPWCIKCGRNPESMDRAVALIGDGGPLDLWMAGAMIAEKVRQVWGEFVV